MVILLPPLRRLCHMTPQQQLEGNSGRNLLSCMKKAALARTIPSDGRSSAATSAPLPHDTATTTRREFGTQSTFLHEESGAGEDGMNGMHRIENTSSTVSHKLIFSPSDGRSSAATSAPVPHDTATTTRRELGAQSTFLHGDSGDGEDG
eukprot:scaffold55036_cov46-Attheya_sp.AAC.1